MKDRFLVRRDAHLNLSQQGIFRLRLQPGKVYATETLKPANTLFCDVKAVRHISGVVVAANGQLHRRCGTVRVKVVSARAREHQPLVVDRRDRLGDRHAVEQARTGGIRSDRERERLP